MGIKMKRSSVAGKAPTTTDLELGELAINTTDGKVYTKKSVGGVEIIVELLTVLSSSFLRNRIINGAMEIWQRGTSFTPGNQYTADRWYCNRSGGVAGVTFSQAYGAFGSKKNWMSVHRTAGDTNTASAVVYQPIEGINCRDLAGQTVTMSLTISSGSTLSSNTNNLSLTLAYQTGGTDIGLAGSWTVSAGSTSFSIPSNTGPTRYSAQFTIPANATQILPYVSLEFAGTAGADDRYYITEVQLEPGSVATPFERRQYGQELALCQRYFIKNADLNGIWIDASNIRNIQHFPVAMRAAPTVSLYDTGGYHEYWNIAAYNGITSVTLLRSTVLDLDFSILSSSNRGRSYGDPSLLAANVVSISAEL